MERPEIISVECADTDGEKHFYEAALQLLIKNNLSNFWAEPSSFSHAGSWCIIHFFLQILFSQRKAADGKQGLSGAAFLRFFSQISACGKDVWNLG